MQWIVKWFVLSSRWISSINEYFKKNLCDLFYFTSKVMLHFLIYIILCHLSIIIRTWNYFMFINWHLLIYIAHWGIIRFTIGIMLKYKNRIIFMNPLGYSQYWSLLYTFLLNVGIGTFEKSTMRQSTNQIKLEASFVNFFNHCSIPEYFIKFHFDCKCFETVKKGNHITFKWT